MGRQFIATVGSLGLGLDLMQLDPPENVRRILDETAEQLEAEEGEKNFRLDRRNISPVVEAWVRERIAGIGDLTQPGKRLDEVDKPLYDEVMRAILYKHAERIAAEEGRQYRGRLRETASMLAAAFSAVTDVGPKWSKLGAVDAAYLWEETAQAVMQAQVIAWKAEDAFGAEDDGDEDE